MSLLTDLRAVSENAVEQIAARFADLPRPLLAAIGAGDMAVERLAELRESLSDSIGERVSSTSFETGDVRSVVSDLPTRAQKVAADVAGGIEQFAADAPARAQELISQLPGKLAEFQTVAQSFSPDAVKGTVDAYTQLVGMIYGSLAKRGDKAWSKAGSSSLRPGAVVDAARPPAPAPAAPVARTEPVAAAGPVDAGARASRSTVGKPDARPRMPRSRIPKAGDAAPERPQAGQRAAGTPTVTTPTPRASMPRSTARPATPKSTAKPATPKSTAKPATPTVTPK